MIDAGEVSRFPRLRSSVVVLDPEPAGDGVERDHRHAGTALPDAFLAAGARSVIAPLWPVSREISDALFRAFHEEESRGGEGSTRPGPAESLRRAQLALLDAGGDAAASGCFSFVVLGAPR